MLTITLNTDVSGRSKAPCKDLTDASAALQRHSNEFCYGMSAERKGHGDVRNEKGKLVARVSSNGRVWPPAPWVPGMEPIQERTQI